MNSIKAMGLALGVLFLGNVASAGECIKLQVKVNIDAQNLEDYRLTVAEHSVSNPYTNKYYYILDEPSVWKRYDFAHTDKCTDVNLFKSNENGVHEICIQGFDDNASVLTVRVSKKDPGFGTWVKSGFTSVEDTIGVFNLNRIAQDIEYGNLKVGDVVRSDESASLSYGNFGDKKDKEFELTQGNALSNDADVVSVSFVYQGRRDW